MPGPIESNAASAAANVNALAAFLEDLRPFWPLLTREWIAWASEQFESEGDYALGHEWAPLSPAYAAWKATHYPGKSILIATGDMRRNVTTPQRVATPQSLELIVDDEKLAYHQEGTDKMPARPVVFGAPLPPKLDARLHEVAEAYADELVQRLRLV